MDANSAEVRGAPELLDGAWLTAALEEAGVAKGALVRNVCVERDLGNGLSARSVRLALDWSEPAHRPASVVGKFPSRDEESRARNFGAGSYVKEWIYYQQIDSTVGVRTPRCHVARYDQSRHDFVLIMEDLAGCVAGDHLEGLSPDRIDLAIDQLVRLHAPRFGDPQLSAVVDQGQPIDRAVAPQFAQAAFQALMPAWLERFGAHVDTDVAEAVARMGPSVARWFVGTETPKTLVHLDYRADNLLFGLTAEDPRIVVIDWQSVNVGIGGTDLAYLVGSSFPDPHHRAAAERDLVLDYRSRMSAAGVDISADTCWRDYRFGSMWALIMSVLASTVATMTDRGEELFAAMAQRAGRQVLELEAFSLLD